MILPFVLASLSGLNGPWDSSAEANSGLNILIWELGFGVFYSMSLRPASSHKFKPLDATIKHELNRMFMLFRELIPHSLQPSFFSKTSHFSRVFGGFPERRIPGKNGEATPRVILFFLCGFHVDAMHF